MLSDALNYSCSSDPYKKTLCFHDFYFQKWNEEVTPNCKAQNSEGLCRITETICCYDTCYRRSAFHINY